MLNAFLWWFTGMVIVMIGSLIPFLGIPLIIIGGILWLVGTFKFVMIIWRKMFGTSATSAVAAPNSARQASRQGSGTGTL